MGKTLIVVDMQNDFITGSLGTKEAQAIVLNVKKKIEEYKKNNNNIIFTRDTHYEDYLETNEGHNLPIKHCIYGTQGWEIPGILDSAKYYHINKPNFGWIHWAGYNFDEVELVGLCTDICVISNALIIKAAYPDANITVDASCCAGTTPDNHKAALTVMKSCQINVIGE